MRKVIVNWSSGKDAAYALYKIAQEAPAALQLRLVTTASQQHQSVSMHDTSLELVQRQANALNIELDVVYLDYSLNMSDYPEKMQKYWDSMLDKGYCWSVFGDIALEQLKTLRESQLHKIGVKAVFPLWNIPSSVLVNQMIELGFKMLVICVNDQYLDKSFLGRNLDKEFLKDLPDHVDPCGENGEFHTFVYDGPVFNTPVCFQKSKVHYKQIEFRNMVIGF